MEEEIQQSDRSGDLNASTFNVTFIPTTTTMQRWCCKAALSIFYSLVTLSLVSPTLGIWPFSPKRFSGNSLIDAGSLGLTAERAVAFGDFNGDQ